MASAMHEINFNGALLERGFWLYVWEIESPDKSRYLYVGRTGDHASGAVQSPFNRLCNHLGSNTHSNALQRHLRKHGIEVACCSLRFLPFGPITMPSALEHRTACDTMQALEKALADALRDAEYKVMNTVGCRTALDQNLWLEVKAAYSQHFARLSQLP
jgi:hypothetical protein